MKFTCQFAVDLYNEGRAAGIAELKAEGRAKGIADGEARLASLIQKLLAASRDEDVQKVVSDPEYRNLLYKQYGIAP